jgi:hypothetical protein
MNNNCSKRNMLGLNMLCMLWKVMYFQDPLQALTTLLSSPQVVFGFHIHPSTPNNSQTYSNLNLAQWSLARHVRSLSLLLTFFFMITLCSCFDFFGYILEHNCRHCERISFFGCNMQLTLLEILGFATVACN